MNIKVLLFWFNVLEGKKSLVTKATLYKTLNVEHTTGFGKNKAKTTLSIFADHTPDFIHL